MIERWGIAVQLLDAIELRSDGHRRIGLWHGDLSNLTPEHRVDALVVTASPDDYVPTLSSMIGALHRRGVSVAGLSSAKDIDLRSTLSCWLFGLAVEPRGSWFRPHPRVRAAEARKPAGSRR